MIYKNALITGTRLGCLNDRGIMTFWITLDYGNSGQDFGGYCLDSYNKDRQERVQSVLTSDLIYNLLLVLGKDSWEDLKGTHVRAMLDKDGLAGKVIGLAHIIKDKEFNFKQHIEDYVNSTT